MAGNGVYIYIYICVCGCVCVCNCTLKNAFQRVRGLIGVLIFLILLLNYCSSVMLLFYWCYTSKTNTCQTSSVNTVVLA